jgi:hypothetical protein
MVRESFHRAGFPSHPNAFFAPLTVNPTEVLDRIAVHKMSFERLVSLETEEAPASTATSDRGRSNIRNPDEFSISLKTYIDALKYTCHIYVQDGRDEPSREAEMEKESHS